MAVSRTLSFVVGLALAGMAAMAALGDEAFPPDASGHLRLKLAAPPVPTVDERGKIECSGHDEELRLLRAIAERLGVK